MIAAALGIAALLFALVAAVALIGNRVERAPAAISPRLPHRGGRLLPGRRRIK